MRKSHGVIASFALVVAGCNPSSEPTHGVDTTLNDTEAASDDVAQVSQSGESANEAVENESSNNTATADANVPTLSAGYLVGTWGPNDTTESATACDTDNVVTFARDGTYRDGGGFGRFRVEGQQVVYYDRVLMEMGEEVEDRSEFDKPLRTAVRPVTKDSIVENGSRWYRCSAD